MVIYMTILVIAAVTAVGLKSEDWKDFLKKFY